MIVVWLQFRVPFRVRVGLGNRVGLRLREDLCTHAINSTDDSNRHLAGQIP